MVEMINSLMAFTIIISLFISTVDRNGLWHILSSCTLPSACVSCFEHIVLYKGAVPGHFLFSLPGAYWLRENFFIFKESHWFPRGMSSCYNNYPSSPSLEISIRCFSPFAHKCIRHKNLRRAIDIGVAGESHLKDAGRVVWSYSRIFSPYQQGFAIGGLPNSKVPVGWMKGAMFLYDTPQLVQWLFEFM